MSFYGKQYKKTKIENVLEHINKLSLSDKTFSFLRETNTLTTYCLNDDGTLQFTVTIDGEDRTVVDLKVELNKETDFLSPDGVMLKSQWTVEGNVVKDTITFPDGKTVTLTRFFEDDGKMKMEIDIAGESTKGYVYYEAV